MSKVAFALILVLNLLACASRRERGELQLSPSLADVPVPPAKTQIKYIYVDRTVPTESAMTMAPLEVPVARNIDVWSDIGRILWPLIALLAAGAGMIVGLYAEHRIIDRQLASRRLRKSQSVS